MHWRYVVAPFIVAGLAYIFIIGTLQTLVFGRWAANTNGYADRLNFGGRSSAR